MYFSRIILNPSVDYQQLAQSLCQDAYREHQALWQLFDSEPEATRDFLFRQTIENGRIKYYVISERIPIDKSGIWLIDPPKLYDPELSEGQRMYFTLRANPVITVSSPNAKQQRHDVVMHEKKRIGYNKLPANERPSLQQIVQSTCLQWLHARSESNGFKILPEYVVVDSYQQHENYSKHQERPLRYSSVNFQGVLTVTEPGTFKQTLYKGIGKSKAFGCGLLLVKRM